MISRPRRSPVLCLLHTATSVWQWPHIRLLPRSISTAASSTEQTWTNPWAQERQDVKSKHLNPDPDSYAITPFTDQCDLTVKAGSGGHGCISFLREKYVPDGPANGGDGGTGGSVWIQAIRGETSLHKLARRGLLSAGRGKNGRGNTQGGQRGEDVLIQVPVGTIVREISRRDPFEEEMALRQRNKGFGADAEEVDDGEGIDQTPKWRKDKWLLYPGGLPRSFTTADFPALPRPRRSNLSASQPKSPIRLDLDVAMEEPVLLAAGAMGGLGNPHFVTKNITRPKYATRGDDGMSLQLHLELKILADVGLVGLPNAGKSTLLRSLTKSRARIGSWAFTTLQPNVGTVVLDDFKTRPYRGAGQHAEAPRESFTIADIPGLVEDAHVDKGLGLGFLRHVERAAVLGFVVDLGSKDPVATLKCLWREVAQYQLLRERELSAETERHFDALGDINVDNPGGSISTSERRMIDPQTTKLTETRITLEDIQVHPASSKPWFVIATKADLPDTQRNFARLRSYIEAVEAGKEEHPCGIKNAWCQKLNLIPISAIKAEGVDRIIPAVLELL